MSEVYSTKYLHRYTEDISYQQLNESLGVLGKIKTNRAQEQEEYTERDCQNQGWT